MKKNIPVAVSKRLIRYYRYLLALDMSNVSKVSSNSLSNKMGFTASQIRQDLNHFGGFGQQGYGYNVKTLLNELGTILGVKSSYTAIIIGSGHLGSAIAYNFNFAKRGIHLKAIFDIRVDLIGTDIQGVSIYDIKDLESYMSSNKIDIAVLTLPKKDTIEIVDRLTKCKIKGIWNFSNMELETNKNIVVENVHLGDSLMSLSFNINSHEYPDDNS